MNEATVEPAPCPTSPSNAETAGADSAVVLLPSEVVGAPNNGTLALDSLPLSSLSSADNMENATQSYAAQNETLKEKPVNFEDTEVQPSLTEAINYQVLAQSSLQAGCVQLCDNLQEFNKEKEDMNMDFASLRNKLSQIEKEKTEVQNALVEKRKECLNKQRGLEYYKVKYEKLRRVAKLNTIYLNKERADGKRKAVKIKEQEETITKLQKKSEKTEKELKVATDLNQEFGLEYFVSITRPTLFNKMVYEQMAKNPVKYASQLKFQSCLAHNNLEDAQSSQDKTPDIPGTSTVPSSSKKRNY